MEWEIGTEVFGDFVLRKTDDGYEITKFTGAFEEVEVPSLINGCQIVGIGTKAFFMNGYIKRVKINEGIKYLGEKAFGKCYNIAEVHLPESVEIIGPEGFTNNIRLKRINLPKNLETIGEKTFRHCRSLESIILPEKLTKINDRLFMGCEKLKEIVIPQEVYKIGEFSFKDCLKLSKVTVLGEIKYASDHAFRNSAVGEFIYAKNIPYLQYRNQLVSLKKDGEVVLRILVGNETPYISYDGNDSDLEAYDSFLIETRLNTTTLMAILMRLEFPEGLSEVNKGGIVDRLRKATNTLISTICESKEYKYIDLCLSYEVFTSKNIVKAIVFSESLGEFDIVDKLRLYSDENIELFKN